MSQQIMPIVSLGGVEPIDMGDLEFIQTKVEAGDYFHEILDISTPANKVTYTVPDGRTAFLIEAKITMNTNPGATSSNQVIGTLQKNINTVITEFSKAKIGQAATITFGLREPGGAGWGVNSESHFNVLGFSLLGSGTDNKIEIENTLDSGDATGEFSGYLV